jgi:hypothetical protein
MRLDYAGGSAKWSFRANFWRAYSSSDGHTRYVRDIPFFYHDSVLKLFSSCKELLVQVLLPSRLLETLTRG